MTLSKKIICSIVIILLTVMPFSAVGAAPIYLLYTSNVNGFLQNCGCGPQPLGGIDRIKFFIDKFRIEHSNVLLIDGGDFFNSYPFPELNEAMYTVLDLMDYDVLIPGDQEFVEGAGFFNRYAAAYKNEIVITNDSNQFKKAFHITLSDHQIYIYGFISEDAFDFIDKTENLQLSPKLGLPDDVKLHRGFVVTIVHGFLADAKTLADNFTNIDLVLLAHDQNRGIWKENNTTIVGNGKNAEYISVIKIEFTHKWKIDIHQIKIDEQIPEDKNVLKIVEKYNQQSELN